MEKIIHLLYTPFTGLGMFNGYRGYEWFRHRMLLFLKYVIPSLENQTNRDFIHWISFRPEEYSNRITEAIYNYLKYSRKSKYRFVFTFGGLCFWDDKNIDDNLLERLQKTLPELKDIVGDSKYVYKTIVPSDDMYHKDVVESIQKEPYREKGALVHHKGYVFNEPTKQLAEWNPPKNSFPPFYTIMYPVDVFLDPQKHFDYVKPYRSHEDIPKIFKTKQLPDNRYCVMVHENNISTNWYCGFKGKVFHGEEKEKILKDFGIEI